MQTLNQDIKDRSFKPVYLLYGDEPFLVSSYKKRMREAIAGDDTMNFNYFEGKNPDVKEIISLADTMPFFAERRLILIDGSGFFKGAPEELVEYLPQMPDTTCMIFCESEVDKRNRLYKKVKDLGHAAELNKQDSAQLMNWAAGILTKDGKKITRQVMEYFLDRTGDDMENIRTELEKLICYCLEKEIIEPADVEAVTTEQISNKIFEMVDAISTHQQKKALELYYDLLALKEPPMRILFLITRQFQILLTVKVMTNKGFGNKDIAAKAGCPEWAVKKYQSQARSYSVEQLRGALEQGGSYEEAVKTGKMNDQMAVELFLIEYSK